MRSLIFVSALVLVAAIVTYQYYAANPRALTTVLLKIKSRIDQHLAKQPEIIEAENDQFASFHKAYITRDDLARLLIHIRGLTGRELIAVIHRTKQYDDHFPLEDILSVLDHGTETIRSDIVPLTLDEAIAICRCHKVDGCLEANPLLLDLAERIDAIIKSRYGGEAFVKISSASGKDAIDEHHKNFRKLYDGYLNSPDYQVYKQRNITWEMNYRVCAISNVHQKILKMETGVETVQMMINSQKIIAHLATAIIFPASFRKSVIIREWTRLNIEQEFRAWVVNNKLIAVSQFSYFCFHEDLVKYNDKIAVAIEEFFNNTVRPKFATLRSAPSRYMIDFLVTDWEKEKPHVMVLEIGGISEYTGLFDRETDEEVFDGTKKNFELRVLRQMNILTELERNIPGWIPYIMEGLDAEAIKREQEEHAKKIEEQEKVNEQAAEKTTETK